MIKYKANISPKIFYFNLTLIFFLTIFLTVIMLDSVIFGTTIFNKIQNEEELQQEFNLYLTGKILSYISNITMLIGYLIYLMIIRHKIKIGYLFIFSWIIVFSALAFSPFYIKDFDENIFKTFLNSLIIVLNSFVIFSLFILSWDIKAKRKIQKYKYYKIHSSRKDLK